MCYTKTCMTCGEPVLYDFYGKHWDHVDPSIDDHHLPRLPVRPFYDDAVLDGVEPLRPDPQFPGDRGY